MSRRSRQFAQPVKLRNPGTAVRDADNTTDLPGPPGDVDSMADLWQLNVQQQVLDDEGTVLADWKGIFPPDAPVTSSTRVIDVASGSLFRVHGQPELLSSLRSNEPDHIAARLKFISDQQGAPA